MPCIGRRITDQEVETLRPVPLTPPCLFDLIFCHTLLADYAVLLTLLFLTPAEHISVSEPLHLLLPVSLMFFSQTATWLPALFPAGLCSQATLIRDTSPDHTMRHTQIHTAANTHSSYYTDFHHSTYHPVISPRTSTAHLWPGVATCECGPVASDFSSQEELKILIFKYS